MTPPLGFESFLKASNLSEKQKCAARLVAEKKTVPSSQASRQDLIDLIEFLLNKVIIDEFDDAITGDDDSQEDANDDNTSRDNFKMEIKHEKQNARLKAN